MSVPGPRAVTTRDCHWPKVVSLSLKPAENRAGAVRAFAKGMSTLGFKVSRKSGEYVKPSLLPVNHSKQSHFGLVDGLIIGFFAVCVGGLIFLLLQI